MKIPNLQTNEPLAPYTTFKIGGPATYFVAVQSKQELLHAIQEAQQEQVPWFILGGGSNILIADSGFDGLVIKAELQSISVDVEQKQVRAEAGARMQSVIQQCAKHGLSGLEFASGVPATVGGAVWANLGAQGSEMKDVLQQVAVLAPNGSETVLTSDQCAFTYRDSVFKHEKYVILEALFQLQSAEPQQIQEKIRALLDKRKQSQAVTERTAGCAFKNPKDQTDQSAAQLIDELGYKGHQIGGAKISDTHANFIINTGDATADDVVMLISYIKQKVRDNLGVQLMEEIEYIGFD